MIDQVLTLIAAEKGGIHPDQVQRVFDALHSEHIKVKEKVEVLSKGTAIDIFFNGKVEDGLNKKIRGFFSPEEMVDVIIQPVKNRKKKMLVSDMDATIIEQESLDELAACVGLKGEVSKITERGMLGELDFAESLKARLEILSGVSLKDVIKTLDVFSFMPGAEKLVKTMSGQNAHCVLVSGGFKFFVDKTANQLGFDRGFGNEFGIDNDALNGQVVEPVIDKFGKERILKDEMQSQNLSADEVLAVGDGANDILMLQAVSSGVAFHAKESVQAIIPHCINYADLTALLYMQGYKDDEFIDS